MMMMQTPYWWWRKYANDGEYEAYADDDVHGVYDYEADGNANMEVMMMTIMAMGYVIMIAHIWW